MDEIKHINDLKCEFCEGNGQYSRDNSDGVAIEGNCTYCDGTGIDQAQLDKVTSPLERQIDSLQDQILKGSVEFEKLRLAHETTMRHLTNFLDEEEARFGNDKKFESPEACQNYIDAAEWAAFKVGRMDHSIRSAEAWLDKEPIDQRPSDYIFKAMSDIIRPV